MLMKELIKFLLIIKKGLNTEIVSVYLKTKLKNTVHCEICFCPVSRSCSSRQ